jgi:hypothetical protein
MLSAPLTGCFADSENMPGEGDLEVNIASLEGGFFQNMELSASSSMSVFIPYLIIEDGNNYVQNSTIVDLEKGDSVTLSILAPPRTENMVVIIGEFGRDFWPIRDQGESWMTWISRGGDIDNSNNGIERVPASENSTFDTVNHSSETGGSVIVKIIPINRAMSLSKDEGGVHSTGIVDGRSVYERLFEMSDPTDSFDIVDGKEGYYDRWAGQGNPAYEDAAQYLISEMTGFGLEVIGHRFEFTDITVLRIPEAYNICAYKWGTEVQK